MLVIIKTKGFTISFNPLNQKLHDAVKEVISDCRWCLRSSKRYFEAEVPGYEEPIPRVYYECRLRDEWFDDFVKTLEERTNGLGMVNLHIKT